VTHSPTTTNPLVALGFTADAAGILHVPAGADVTLTPIGRFFELKITLNTGATVVATLHKFALKVRREGVGP
jgi:hypothetical protein